MKIRRWLARVEDGARASMREVIALMRERPAGENALMLDSDISPERRDKALAWMTRATHAHGPNRRAFVTEALCAANGR